MAGSSLFLARALVEKEIKRKKINRKEKTHKNYTKTKT